MYMKYEKWIEKTILCINTIAHFASNMNHTSSHTLSRTHVYNVHTYITSTNCT